jgi:hypothetical protein
MLSGVDMELIPVSDNALLDWGMENQNTGFADT